MAHAGLRIAACDVCREEILKILCVCHRETTPSRMLAASWRASWEKMAYKDYTHCRISFVFIMSTVVNILWMWWWCLHNTFADENILPGCLCVYVAVVRDKVHKRSFFRVFVRFTTWVGKREQPIIYSSFTRRTSLGVCRSFQLTHVSVCPQNCSRFYFSLHCTASSNLKGTHAECRGYSNSFFCCGRM